MHPLCSPFFVFLCFSLFCIFLELKNCWPSKVKNKQIWLVGFFLNNSLIWKWKLNLTLLLFRYASSILIWRIFKTLLLRILNYTICADWCHNFLKVEIPLNDCTWNTLLHLHVIPYNYFSLFFLLFFQKVFSRNHCMSILYVSIPLP